MHIHCSTLAYLNAFELTPTKQSERRKNPKTAHGIFQVVQLSPSEPEPASPYDQVPMAGSTSDVKNTSDDWTMDYENNLHTYLHRVTQWRMH